MGDHAASSLRGPKARGNPDRRGRRFVVSENPGAAWIGTSRSPSNISGGFAAALNDSGLPRRCAPRNDGVFPALPWRIPLLSNGRGNEPNARDNAPNPQPPVIARAEGPWQPIGFHPRDDVSLPFCLNAEWLSRTIAFPCSDPSKKLNAMALPQKSPRPRQPWLNGGFALPVRIFIRQRKRS
ncbi:MAG: hypothetical protein LBQ62_10370 [Candidatus Accumulibacter sp.]|nr:hypothetical protein [Accumulibacter sp.]